MDYYATRSRAMQDVAQMLEKELSRKRIYYAIGINYGFSKRICDEMIDTITNGVEDG